MGVGGLCVLVVSFLEVDFGEARRVSPFQKQEVVEEKPDKPRGVERFSREKIGEKKISTEDEWEDKWDEIHMKRAADRKQAILDFIEPELPQTKTLPARRPDFEVYNPYSSGELVNRYLVKDAPFPSGLWRFLGRSDDFGKSGVILWETLADFSFDSAIFSDEFFDLESQGISEILSAGNSNFRGESSASKHNIALGMKRLHGIVVKRGERFSFNDAIGDLSGEEGFREAATILNGEIDFVAGGGVCHLSTALFRAALNAGLPITDRRNHSIQLDTYNPVGFEGLEATIFQGVQDFAFVNNTPGDLLLSFGVRGNELVVVFYGTDDRAVALERRGAKVLGDRLVYEWGMEIDFEDGRRERRVVRSGYLR